MEARRQAAGKRPASAGVAHRSPATQLQGIWRLSELCEPSKCTIAKRLNLPLPVVRSRLRRARLMLRRILREEFSDRVWLARGKAPRI